MGGLAVAGTAGFLGVDHERVAAEPPPETTRIRLAKTGALCMSPPLVAEDLLRGEGFADVQYVARPDLAAAEQALASGDVDLNVSYALRMVVRLDAGDPIVVLAGLHVGCVEVLGGHSVRSIRDLKGKRIAAGRVGSGVPAFIGLILGHIGLTVQTDVELIVRPAPEAIALFKEGKADAFIGIPPEPQELRASRVGHVVLDTGRDRPWSQYFCCMVAANRSFYRRHPVATKRAVRALLKAADMCSASPDTAARLLVDRGHTPNYEYARETLRGLPYRAWRNFEPEDALRFYGLRLHEARVVTSSPKSLISEGTDWRIVRELRKELKG